MESYRNIFVFYFNIKDLIFLSFVWGVLCGMQDICARGWTRALVLVGAECD